MERFNQIIEHAVHLSTSDISVFLICEIADILETRRCDIDEHVVIELERIITEYNEYQFKSMYSYVGKEIESYPEICKDVKRFKPVFEFDY